jgi:hypothetical protein
MFDRVYDTHRQIEEHLAAFLDACNFAKRLKTLTWPNIYEATCKARADRSASLDTIKQFHFGTEHLVKALIQRKRRNRDTNSKCWKNPN